MKFRQKAIWLCFAAPLALAGCATGRSVTSLPDRLELGRDSNGEPCQANRSFTSSALTGATDVAFAINCRGVSASRSFGTVSAVKLAAARAMRQENCGVAATIHLEGVGPVAARRCLDKELGLPTVEITMERDGLLYRGSSVLNVLAPMERAFRTIAGFKPPNDASNLQAAASIRTDALAAAPAPAEGTAIAGAQSDAEIALRQGLLLNRQGLYVEASQLLNDALSRLPARTSPSVRAEIALEAALADSNIRVREAAAAHFAEAGRILKENPNIDRASFLEQKRSIYHALDALNRRDWGAALSALATSQSASPLEDPAVLAEVNQAISGTRDTSSAVSGANAEQLNQLVIDAQRSWAASVAHLAQRQPGSAEASQRELNRAIRNIQLLLSSSIDPSSVIWLSAQVERQAGRLEARNAAAAEGRGYEPALAKFDCAIAALQGTAPRSEAACAIALSAEARARLRRGGQVSSGPVLAETQMEQASLLTRAGRSPAEVAAKYDEAVDALIAANRSGVTVPAGLETYLALLSEEAQKDSSGASERFFKALQVVGEPATARQLSRLQQIVTSDGTTAAKVRDRNELERAITALRYAIAETGDPATRGSLEAQRAEKERQRVELDAELKSTRYSTTDDRPATVAEVQRALSAGEVYWKLADVRGQLFGIAIGRDQTNVYQVKESGRTVRALASRVRSSISDGSDKVPFFNVGSSAALFQIIAGPAERQLRQAQALIVDPAGPLNELPAGVLVTDVASARAYAATRKTAPNDYSKVRFLARQSDLQTALSPRSFLISRSLASSTAPKPFIGFGEHSVTPLPRVASAEPIRIGSGCPIGYQELAHVIAQNKPISAHKIAVAAGALGVPNAPRVTGAAFTDSAVEDMPDIDQYQILHFATHGVPEERIGCVNIPPSLITTLGGQGSDGFLSFDEIARMRLNANLVVLSACETAAGVSSGLARRSGQEEGGQAALSGLVRAFLAANSRAVLATYWKVSAEEESDALFKTFYSAGRTQTIRGALKAAQNSLIDAPRYSHPFYWGAYFVVGDASKPMLTRS